MLIKLRYGIRVEVTMEDLLGISIYNVYLYEYY